MVTDHSSVGFEYLVLDRPLLVVRRARSACAAARINPEKLVLCERRHRRADGR
jgi:CDP-glycerol glycerophosphotransferase (TagB/SpsB family)